MLPDPKSTERYERNINRAIQCTQRVIDYLYNFAADEGETHATRLLCLETTVGVRDLDLLLIHLPTHYSKRQLYEIFCFKVGIKYNLLVTVHTSL